MLDMPSYLCMAGHADAKEIAKGGGKGASTVATEGRACAEPPDAVAFELAAQGLPLWTKQRVAAQVITAYACHARRAVSPELYLVEITNGSQLTCNLGP